MLRRHEGHFDRTIECISPTTELAYVRNRSGAISRARAAAASTVDAKRCRSCISVRKIQVSS